MKTLSATIAAEIAKTGTVPRVLFRLFLDGGALYYTNHTSDIAFQGQTYTAWRISHGPVKTSFENRVDSCTLTIDNVDQAMSAYYAYENFEGRKAEIWKVFLDESLAVIDGSPGSDDKIIVFRGEMDLPQVNDNTLTVRVANLFDRGPDSQSPGRTFGARCNWEYCGPDCQYRGGLGKLTGTATGGTINTLIDTGIPSDAYNVNDYWKGGRIKIIAGTGAGDDRLISGYDAAAKRFTVYLDFSAVIDATSRYLVECDKSRPACDGFSNYARFDGYEEREYLLTGFKSHITSNSSIEGFILDPETFSNPIAHIFADISGDFNMSAVVRAAGAISTGATPVPLIYGEHPVPGTIIADGRINNYRHTRLYAFCEGEVDSITRVTVNGVSIDLTKATAYQQRLGAAGQSLQESDFGVGSDWDLPTANVYYHPRLVYIGIKSKRSLGEETFDALGRYVNLLNTTGDTVTAVIRGLKVQKYLADGAPDGAPAWSDNPVWCALDFLMKRVKRPVVAADIDFAYWKASADASAAYGYRLSMAITAGTRDTEILDQMLRACRGYFFYPAGKIALNIETAWTGPVAHAFGDHTIAADNLSNFKYYKKAVNDVHNRVVVEYIDCEIRKNMAMVSGYLSKSATTIPYGDLRGVFTASGTLYIGAEAVTYTGDTGAAFTGCSARINDYASGYPIYQGDQLFSVETAIYDDEVHQAEVGKVMEKTIKAHAVPTYALARELAEWYCRKSVQGNQRCSFRGFIDSLHVTVGDVANVTHSLPGWIDVPFRVLTASETQDEEVDYECELYDASFYARNTHTPPVRISTTLPNPNEPLGNATGLSLSESGYVGDDGTYVPTVTLTYSLPDPAIFWGSALVHVKVNAGNYVDYGVDVSRGAGFVIDGLAAGFKPGDSVTVKVISVSVRGVISDANTSPTVVEPIDGAIIDPATPTGLALEGGGTTWNGRKHAVVWAALGAGADPSYQFSEVEYWTGGVLRHTFTPIKENRFEYVYGDGIAAGLDPHIVTANGAITIKVRRKNSYGSVSSYATLAITNAAPQNPQNLAGTGVIRGAVFTWDKNTEADFKEYRVRTKITSGGAFSGWSAVTDNTYVRELTPAEIAASGATAAIYIEVVARDLYGNDSTTSSTNTAALTLSVGAMDMTNVPEGYNQLINSDFENGFDGWVKSGGALPGAVVQAANPKTGAYCVENSVGSYVSYYSDRFIPVQQDRVLVPECYLKTKTAGTSGTSNARLYFYDKDKVLLTYYSFITVVPPADFTYYSGVIGPGQPNTYPAGAAYYKAYFYLNSDGVAGGDRVQQIQGFRVREVIESAYIKNLAVTTGKIADLGVTTAKIADLAVTNAKVNDLSADKINVGSLRGINVQSATFMTKGSYLTAVPGAGAATLYVKDTTDFPDPGAGTAYGWIIDAASGKDRDYFSYTGKTATTLTGLPASGDNAVLGGHTNGATIIPALKDILIDDAVNEMRFYGDRGDGTIEELVNIGIVQSGSDYIVGMFGSSNSGNSRIGLWGASFSNAGVMARSSAGVCLKCQPTGGLNSGVDLELGGNYNTIPASIGAYQIKSTNDGYNGFYVLSPQSGQAVILGPHLIYDSGALASAVNNHLISSLDGNAHGGYNFEFVIVNPSGTPTFDLFYNADITPTNYYNSSHYGGTTHAGGGANNAAMASIGGAGTIVVAGTITITPAGLVVANYQHHRFVSGVEAYVTNAGHHKIATVVNLTSITVSVSGGGSNIGINSRFRLWRKK